MPFTFLTQIIRYGPVSSGNCRSASTLRGGSPIPYNIPFGTQLIGSPGLMSQELFRMHDFRPIDNQPMSCQPVSSTRLVQPPATLHQSMPMIGLASSSRPTSTHHTPISTRLPCRTTTTTTTQDQPQVTAFQHKPVTAEIPSQAPMHIPFGAQASKHSTYIQVCVVEEVLDSSKILCRVLIQRGHLEGLVVR